MRRGRRALLNDAALAVATLWVQTLSEDIRREGREVCGGWPGTVPEARARVTLFCSLELERHHMSKLTADEVGWTSRAAYDKAKRDWLALT